MAETTIKSGNLKLKASVTAPEELTLHGSLTGARNEIVVLNHIGRVVKQDAYVCHITNGKYGEGVYDMPGFPFISISLWEIQVKTIDGVNFIMVCNAEAHKDPAKYTVRPNWL